MLGRLRFWLCTALALLSAGAIAAEGSYPSRPIRLVVPFPPGASNDTVARLVGQKLAEALGREVVIDNRSGAGGSIGAAILARAPADGYTLMATSVSYATNAAILPSLPFDPVSDVAGVAMIGRGPMMVVVWPGLPVTSIKELVAYARSQPQKVNYTSSGVGSAPHLATELFNRLAGVELVHIPYKGLGPAMIDMVAGRAHLLIASLPSVMPHVKANRLRGLALTGAKASPFVPGMPTVAESGVPGYTSEQWWALFAPARTPEALVRRLNAETRKLVAGDEMKAMLESAGGEPAALSPAEVNALVKDEITKWRRVVKERGIKVD